MIPPILVSTCVPFLFKVPKLGLTHKSEISFKEDVMANKNIGSIKASPPPTPSNSLLPFVIKNFIEAPDNTIVSYTEPEILWFDIEGGDNTCRIHLQQL